MEMLIFQFILIATLVNAVRWVDLEKINILEGQMNGKITTCHNYHYITTLTIFSQYDTFLEQISCGGPISQWDNGEVLFKNVYLGPNRLESRWFLCPVGYFLSGFQHSDKVVRTWHFADISVMQCVKPAGHPLYYDKCLSHNVSGRYSRDFSCHENDNFMIGLKTGENGFFTFNIDKIACCTMVKKPQDIESTEDIKKRIMDTNLKPLVDLAALLGFHSCEGKSSLFCTDGYERKNYTWEPKDKKDHSHKNCPKHEPCYKGLEIVYENWGLAVKEMKYGKIETSSLQPETVDHGTIYNRANAKVTESYLISKTVSNTVTNTKTNTLNFGFEFSAKLEIDVAKLFEGTMSYTFMYDTSNTKTEQEETFNSTTYTTHSQITLEPMTAAKYNVTFSQSKSFANYTVVVLVTFSVKLTGALKTGGKFYGNNHHLYQDNEEETYVQYSFGDKNIPFYKALKSESESYAQPWLWNDITDFKNKNLSSLIHRLTDERQYEFELKGHLEGVAGAKIQVAWQEMPIDEP